MISIRLTRTIFHFNPRSPHGERQKRYPWTDMTADISTHAPRTGSDLSSISFPVNGIQFQPTLPARGATTEHYIPLNLSADFNPRSPHGERPETAETNAASAKFQPTLPARGATLRNGLQKSAMTDFNPRSPHGERHDAVRILRALRHFNPRSPHGERHKTVSTRA